MGQSHAFCLAELYATRADTVGFEPTTLCLQLEHLADGITDMIHNSHKYSNHLSYVSNV